MFEELIEKLDGSIRRLRGTGKLTEKSVAEAMRDIRRVLLEADVHYKVARTFIQRVQERAVGQEVLRSVTPGQMVVKIVHDELVRLLGTTHRSIHFSSTPPSIIMVVGLQGSGKTTLSAKLALHLKKRNHVPLLAAADRIRPAAVEQLETLGRSIDVGVFSENESSETLCKKAVAEARKRGCDTLIIDTAGRLHVDETMMQELAAVAKAVKPEEILYAADGMTGQDAVQSATSFLERLDFHGVALTKMDGDARGGAALSILEVTGRPIKFLSAGERLDALDVFHPERMASRILGMGDVVTLVEKAREAVDQKQAERLAEKIGKQTFTLEDFLGQIQQVKKMGSVQHLVSMMPGMNQKAMKDIHADEGTIKRTEAMIHSMTREERRRPQIIDGSRRKRIARGSGTSVQEVNRLLKQFQMMQKMFRQFSSIKKGRLPPGFSLG